MCQTLAQQSDMFSFGKQPFSLLAHDTRLLGQPSTALIPIQRRQEHTNLILQFRRLVLPGRCSTRARGHVDLLQGASLLEVLVDGQAVVRLGGWLGGQDIVIHETSRVIGFVSIV